MLEKIRKTLGKLIIPENRHHSIVWKAAEMQAAIPLTGHYFEFGVFEGKSLIQAYFAFKKFLNHDSFSRMKFYAFDSFAGIPEPEGIDKVVQSFSGGECFCTRDKFEKNLIKNNVDTGQVIITEGYFEKTLTPGFAAGLEDRQAVFIHVDCDLYNSTRTVLDFITPLLGNGSVISFDDWYLFGGHPELGQHRAFIEWKEKNREWYVEEFQKEATTKNSFILNKTGLVN